MGNIPIFMGIYPVSLYIDKTFSYYMKLQCKAGFLLDVRSCILSFIPPSVILFAYFNYFIYLE